MKYIWTLLLLIPLVANAGSIMIIGGGVPAAAPSGNSDNFNRTDEALTTPWAATSEVITDLKVASNVVDVEYDWSYGSARYSTSSSDTSQILAKALADNGGKQGACVRMGAAATGYCLFMMTYTGGNWTQITLQKNGSWIWDESDHTWSGTSDHTLKITASGTSTVSFRVWVDNVEITGVTSDTTDTLTSGNPGFTVGSGSSAHPKMDNWQDY